MEHTVKEQKIGKFEPEIDAPQWELYFKDGKVESNIPYKELLPTLRFPRAQQGKDDSSYTYRPIDDCRGSGLNPSTGFSEQMRMHNGLETLLTTAHYVRKKFVGWGTAAEPVFAKGDHEKAYRQWPVHPQDHHMVVTLVWSHDVGTTGGYQVFAHRSQPFGALRAVWMYTGISQGVCHILRRLFAVLVLQLAYVDDFLKVERQNWAAAKENAFRRVHKLLGIPFKIGKGHSCRKIVALGHQIAATQDWAGLKQIEQCRTNVLQKISTSSSTGFKDPELPELAGHTNFGLQAVSGKAARTYARTVSQGKKGTAAEQPRHVYESLQWLETIFHQPPTCTERSGTHYAHTLLPDGFWDPVKQYGLSGAALLRQHGQNLTYGTSVPDHIAAQHLTTTEEKLTKAQHNAQCELLAILSAVMTWCKELRGGMLLIPKRLNSVTGQPHFWKVSR